MIDDDIRAVLATIHDPCSVAAGRPTSILDMGLVLGWTLDRGTLTISFCVTFGGCTMAPHFVEAARTGLLALPGISAVRTRIDTDHVWMPPPLQPMAGKPQAWRLAT